MFNSNYKVILCLVLTLSLWSSHALATDYKVHSPNGDLKATISTAGGLNYAIEKNGETLVAPSQIALLSDISTAETFTKVIKITEASASDDFELVWGTSKHIVEQYNQLNLWFTEAIGIEFRMYNEGAAWRYVTTSDEELIVINEVAEFNFYRSETVYFPHVAGFSNPFEPEYLPQTASDVEEGSLGMIPSNGKHLLRITKYT